MKNQTKFLIFSLIVVLMFACEKEEQTYDDKTAQTFLEDVKFNSDGVVAYYPFNGDVKDYSGNDNHGTANGIEFSEDRFHKLNGACLLSGDNSYIEISNTSLLNNDTYTICFWYRSDLSDTLNQSLLTKSDSLGNGYIIDIANHGHYTYLSFIYKHVTDPVFSSTSLSPTSRFWSADQEQEFEFAAVSFSNSELYNYITGSYFSGFQFIFNDNNFDLNIGKGICMDLKSYKGEIDDLLIYNRMLSIEEVQAIYDWRMN